MLFQGRLSSYSMLVVSLLVIVGCVGNAPGDPSMDGEPRASLDINTLGEGTEIRSAGLRLMESPLGLIELRNGDQANDSVLVIAVHGYQSRGYEWITGIKNLADHYGSLFFYRYDWDRCPDQVAQHLASQINAMVKTGSYRRVLIFGHSYGGIVVMYAASEFAGFDTEIHIIAAPLSGFPGLLDQCGSLQYDTDDKLVYPKWKRSVQVIQHKTVHAQDGAFRELAINPQDIDLDFKYIQELPPTMDGHRLGHNWSVSWVLDQHVGKPHRY
ncbi:MAG: alpha/beta hydrolase [Candidatus Marinimicrobia bacterium]|nr:alpha/beta hydrolase [Candidatus Neomarinimicrobiota bacterium]